MSRWSAPLWPVGVIMGAAGGMLLQSASTNISWLDWLADPASWFGDAGLIGSVVGFLTLLFVWRTVVHAREAAQAGREASFAAIKANTLSQRAYVGDHRAWLKLVSVQVTGDLEWTEFGFRLGVVPQFENIGRTPALFVLTNVDYFVARHDAIAACEGRLNEIERGGSRDSTFGETLFPGAITKMGVTRGVQLSAAELVMSQRPAIPFWAVVSATYRLTVDGTNHVTAAAFYLRRQGGGISAQHGPVIPASELSLEHEPALALVAT